MGNSAWLRGRRRWLLAGGLAAVIATGALAYLTLSPGSGTEPQAAAGPTPAAGQALTTSAPAGPSGTTGTGAPQPSTSTVTSTKAATAPAPTATGATRGGTTAPGTAQATSGSTSAPAAGRIRPGQTRTGVATFYQGAQNTGACLFDPSPDHLTAAMNEKDYEGSNACGAYVEVHGSNGATITVRITNLCPYPCRVGQLDLDPEAYKLLAPLQTGETPITWKLVSPNLSGGISIRYKTGSTQWWCGIQVINHRNPVARLEVATAGTWKALPRTGYNYFLSAKGAGCGGGIRITDLYGQTLTISPLPIRADVTQATDLQFARH